MTKPSVAYCTVFCTLLMFVSACMEQEMTTGKGRGAIRGLDVDFSGSPGNSNAGSGSGGAIVDPISGGNTFFQITVASQGYLSHPFLGKLAPLSGKSTDRYGNLRVQESRYWSEDLQSFISLYRKTNSMHQTFRSTSLESWGSINHNVLYIEDLGLALQYNSMPTPGLAKNILHETLYTSWFRSYSYNSNGNWINQGRDWLLCYYDHQFSQFQESINFIAGNDSIPLTDLIDEVLDEELDGIENPIQALAYIEEVLCQ